MKNMNMFGVYDTIYGDFIESFKTREDAEKYINNQKSPYADGSKALKLVKFLDNKNPMNTEYKELKRF